MTAENHEPEQTRRNFKFILDSISKAHTDFCKHTGLTPKRLICARDVYEVIAVYLHQYGYKHIRFPKYDMFYDMQIILSATAPNGFIEILPDNNEDIYLRTDALYRNTNK